MLTADCRRLLVDMSAHIVSPSMLMLQESCQSYIEQPGTCNRVIQSEGSREVPRGLSFMAGGVYLAKGS